MRYCLTESGSQAGSPEYIVGAAVARTCGFERNGEVGGGTGLVIIRAAMLKFQCERCGERIAVQSRHLGRLVCCPQCGNATHPLAGQILTMHSGTASGAKANGSKPPKPKRPNGHAKSDSLTAAADAPDRPRPDKSDKPRKPAAPPLEECANCGRAIGRLQKTERWKDQTVCAVCAEALARESKPTTPTEIVKVPTPTRVGVAEPAALGDRMRKAATDFRNGILWALVAVALAVGLLYLLLALLRSLGGVLTAVALVAGALVVGYFVYRAYGAVRRKLSHLNETARSIVKLR